MGFRRDRLTWLACVLLAWFAYLQVAPGLVIAHLRDELDLSYATGGLHVAAFAGGSIVAGVVSARLERALGRRTLLWSAAALMGAGATGLTAGRSATVTVGPVLVMGVGGGLLLVTIQAALADHHGEGRMVALTEANVAASIAYVVLISVLSLTALHAGWRVALLASLASGARVVEHPEARDRPGARPSLRTPPTSRRTPQSPSWPATSAAWWSGAWPGAGWRASTTRRSCSRSSSS